MPNPTIARVQRLVPAAAAADEADLAGDRRIGAHDVDRVDLHAHEVGMGQAEPGTDSSTTRFGSLMIFFTGIPSTWLPHAARPCIGADAALPVNLRPTEGRW